MNKSDPSFCWTCGAKLHRGSHGKLIFLEKLDPLGNSHRVHKKCSLEIFEERQAFEENLRLSLELEEMKIPYDPNDKEYT